MVLLPHHVVARMLWQLLCHCPVCDYVMLPCAQLPPSLSDESGTSLPT